METTSLPRNHWIARLLASLGLVLILATSASAQDKPSKGKTSEKAPKKAAPKADAPDVTYLDLSGPSEPESDLPTIVKKGTL